LEDKWVFLGHEELNMVRQLRKEGDIDKAEQMLRKGEPSEAVLDELRKIASTRARASKKVGDWEGVIRHLEGYNEYAKQWREYCLRMVNAEPPVHTEQDEKLLEEAKRKVK